MEIYCPKCKGRLQIADEHAGKHVQCPLCREIFQAVPPSIPFTAEAVPGASPTPSPGATSSVPGMAPPMSSVSAPPTPPEVSPAPATGSVPPANQQTIPSPQPQAAAPPRHPESPPTIPVSAGTEHHWTIPLRRQVVSWLVLVCLGIVFLLTFFPWIWRAEHVNGLGQWEWRGKNAWGVTFVGSARNIPAIIYLIFLILALLLSAAAALLPTLAKSPGTPLPASVLRWRYAFVGGLLLFLLLLLFLQLLLAFADEARPDRLTLRSAWLSWASLFHIFSLVFALLSLWLDQRGQRPEPRLELVW